MLTNLVTQIDFLNADKSRAVILEAPYNDDLTVLVMPYLGDYDEHIASPKIPIMNEMLNILDKDEYNDLYFC